MLWTGSSTALPASTEHKCKVKSGQGWLASFSASIECCEAPAGSKAAKAASEKPEKPRKVSFINFILAAMLASSFEQKGKARLRAKWLSRPHSTSEGSQPAQQPESVPVHQDPHVRAVQVARKSSKTGGTSDDAPEEQDFSRPYSASEGDPASAAVQIRLKSPSKHLRAVQVARKWSESGGKSDDAPEELDFSRPHSASEGEPASANGSAVDLSAKSRIDVSDDEPEDTSEGGLLLC